MKIEEEIKKLKTKNESLKSQIVIPVEKVDREISSGQFKEDCDKCYENAKVNLYILKLIFIKIFLFYNSPRFPYSFFRHLMT